MTIILIRHGETDLNRARTLQPPETPLSELGRQQAGLLASSLRDRRVDAILSSDLARAAETAEAVATELELSVQYSALLHERNFGDLRGQPYSSLSVNPMEEHYAPPNGETWEEFRRRVADAFELVMKLAHSSMHTIAVVTHGLVIRELATRHLQNDTPVPEHFENTSITIFDKQPPHRTQLIANADHIDELMQQHRLTGQTGGLV